jgi:hypothetical protein
MDTSSLSDKVREVAKKEYVQRAKQAGKSELSIAVRDLMKHLDKAEFPGNRVPLICNAIRTRGFQRENGLEITSVDGPRSKSSPTVVIHYRIGVEKQTAGPESVEPDHRSAEDAESRATRLTNKLRGLLKEELAAYGGADAFMRWIRGYDEDGQ